MNMKMVVMLGAGLLAGLGLAQTLRPPVAESQEQKPTTKPAVAPDVERIQAGAAEFAKAFNAGDAAAIGQMFTENAEVVDEAGDLTQGRKAITDRFAAVFKAYPQAKIAVEIGTIRQLSPDVAVEDGYSATTFSPEEPGVRSPYTVVHLKRDGKWLFASVRDYPPDEVITSHDQLLPLEWLVGHWMDESRSGRVETHCRWSDDGNYLLQDYVVKTREGRELRGTQRIGYDPLRKTVRAWSFDDSGAFSESFWTPVEGNWIIKANGVTPTGEAASATRVLIPYANDAFELISRDQLLGNEQLPDSAVRVVRRPPQPGQ